MKGPLAPGVLLLRLMVSTLLFIHGAARVQNGVDGFGVWLEGEGVPMGLVVAWLVTGMELVGTPLLALGRFVRPLCVWFTGVLVAGIVMVHYPEGWFVVGAGRNGMEYSVLLITCLTSLSMAHGGASSPAPAGKDKKEKKDKKK